MKILKFYFLGSPTFGYLKSLIFFFTQRQVSFATFADDDFEQQTFGKVLNAKFIWVLPTLEFKRNYI